MQQELIPELPLLSGATRSTQLGYVAGAHSSLSRPPRMRSYDASETFIGTCPDCQSQLEMAEGCMKCHICGFSECG